MARHCVDVDLLDRVLRPALRIGVAGGKALGCRRLAKPDAVLPADVQHPGVAPDIADLMAHVPRSRTDVVALAGNRRVAGKWAGAGCDLRILVESQELRHAGISWPAPVAAPCPEGRGSGTLPSFPVSPLCAASLVFLRPGLDLDARHERDDTVIQRDHYALFPRRIAPGGEEIAGLSRQHLSPLYVARSRTDTVALEIPYGGGGRGAVEAK